MLGLGVQTVHVLCVLGICDELSVFPLLGILGVPGVLCKEGSKRRDVYGS